MDDMRKQRLGEFVAWTSVHIVGDEKGEAQVFLDRLFQAFGQKGAKDVGGVYEQRVRNEAGGTSFADYIWKPIVLIEMKKRGTDLSKHYRQAFDYWVRAVPSRPRYVILCNFDTFDIYDFDKQLDAPVDTLKLSELPNRYGPLAFLFPTKETPVFGNDRVAVTRDAADKLAACFNKLVIRGVDRSLAQRFILQALVALFAEDIDLLPRNLLDVLLEECKKPEDSYDLIGGLFEAMNNPQGTKGGRYKGVRYFNGGLFSIPARIELHPDEVDQLKQAAKADWSKVSPDIFGTLFEHSLGKEARHAFGAHYTSPTDIMKIVKPTIVDPWTERIEGAKTLRELLDLQHRMSTYTVLDPACGSGNFLYLAYRELKRLEVRTLERLTTEFASQKQLKDAPKFSFVLAKQFYGIDINPFAIELAKVTMMIARKLAIDELHITENALPLDNLDKNFLAVDALVDDLGNPCQWPKADVIIGNPPFLGPKDIKPAHGVEYVHKIRKAYPDVPGMADFCVYWIRKAHDYLPACTDADWLAGRAGLVGTQNVRNNQSRVGGLDHVVSTGTIVEAVDNQPWSGEANVNVAITNWVKTQDEVLLPKRRRLWKKLPSAPGPRRRRGEKNASKVYELACRECDFINAALSDQVDVTAAKRLQCNYKPKRAFQGITPGHKAFVLSDLDQRTIVGKDPASRGVIYPYLIGREMVTGDGTPSRFLIDFEQRSLIDCQPYQEALKRVEAKVLPTRKAAAEKGKDKAGNMRPHHRQFLDRWWKLAWDRADMIAAIQNHRRYIVCSRVTKRPIFVFVDTRIRPGDALQTFIFDDDYSFGILQSDAHWRWFTAKCSNLTERFRYTAESVFDTFPWPQSPTKRQIDDVATAAKEVRRVRADALSKTKGGLRAVYRTLELPGKSPLKDAHAALDTAVLIAYGFSPKKDVLSQLLTLNERVATLIKEEQIVTGPGVPTSYGDRKPLVTDDCVQP